MVQMPILLSFLLSFLISHLFCTTNFLGGKNIIILKMGNHRLMILAVKKRKLEKGGKRWLHPWLPRIVN